MPGVRHERVDAGGLRTHVALAGPDDGEPTLLVHGWPQNFYEWRDVIPPLVAAGRRVICPDLRGHGWTDAPAGGYDKEQLATDVLALLDALRVERVTWVGHDWGAWTGWLAALRAPERIERLVNFGVPHLWGGRDPRSLVLLAYQGPISAPLLGPFIARRGVVPLVLRGGRRLGRYSAMETEVFAGPLRENPHVTVALYRTFLTREMAPLLGGRYAGRTLEVPATLTVGGADLVTKTMSPGPVEGQPKLRVEVLDGVGHFLPEEVPDVVVERILSPA